MRWLWTAAVCATAAAAPVRAAFLVPPAVPIGGATQAEWTGRWWKQALEAPDGTSLPADGPPAAGNRGAVFFLAGAFTSGGLATATRSVTVVQGQTLFFPLVNILTTEYDSLYGTTEAGMAQDAREFLGVGSGLFVTWNGAALPTPPGTTLNDFLLVSPLFGMNFAPGSTADGFGYPTGPVTAVAAGYWAAVGGLTPGTYTLRFGGTATANGIYAGVPPFSQDITYQVTVTPSPAPPTLVLAGLGLLAGGLARVSRGTASRSTRAARPGCSPRSGGTAA